MTRRRKARGPSVFPEPYAARSEEVRRFIEALPGMLREGERTLAERAGTVLDRFETEVIADGAPKAAGRPARYALAVLVDQQVRASRGVRLSAWGASAHRALFDGRDMSIDEIRKFRDTADGAGPDYAPLSAFLDGIIAELEGARRKREHLSRGPAVLIAVCVVLFLVSLAGYAGYLDYRYHARTVRAFTAEAATIPPATGALDGSLAIRLGALADAAGRVERAAAEAPLADIAPQPFLRSEVYARRTYEEAVRAALPQAIAEAIGESLATEGDSLALYDTLRAWSVLSGETEWSPAYLAGWLEDHGKALGAGGLARHAEVLEDPDLTLLPPDPDLIEQARGFASELPEAERAFLELKRDSGVRALPDWSPEEAVPGLGDILTRRSGAALGEGMAGLFTEAGWAYARDIGSGIAVQRARAVAPVVVASPTPPQNDAPDLLMDTLQRETIAHWQDWLADLRVRPFADRETAVLISGALAQRNSPLEQLLREVWAQVGGNDRLRTHAHQIRIATTFNPIIQYIEQGRVAEISRLFSKLNVALGSIDFDEERGANRLMSLNDRAQSVAALRAAPRLIVQITEDVLAQASAAHASLLSNPITRAWQRDVYPLCRAAVDGQYPFAEGPDTDIGRFGDLFGPGGALQRFFAAHAERYIDTGVNPWHWRPEARLSGLTQESAEFLQKAISISEGFFGPGGTLGTEMTLAALAERGEAMLVLGGAGVPVRATGDPETLAWPGPEPGRGAEVTFRQGEATARLIGEGPWGFFHLLDRMRLRPRDQGRRMLVDIRSEQGRLFVEMVFPSVPNPVSARSLMKDFACPPVL